MKWIDVIGWSVILAIVAVLLCEMIVAIQVSVETLKNIEL